MWSGMRVGSRPANWCFTAQFEGATLFKNLKPFTSVRSKRSVSGEKEAGRPDTMVLTARAWSCVLEAWLAGHAGGVGSMSPATLATTASRY